MLSVWSGHCVLGKQALCNVNVSPNAHSPHLALANDGLWLAFMPFLIQERNKSRYKIQLKSYIYLHFQRLKKIVG